MGRTLQWDNNIRKSSPDDIGCIHQHLSSLDEMSIKSRFGNIVTRAFIQQYARAIFYSGSVVFVCDVDGDIRGLGELRPLNKDKLSAETVFTVDARFRDQGIGTALMAAAIEEASRIGVNEIFSCFDAYNLRMARIAEKFRAEMMSRDCNRIARIGIGAESRFWPRAARLTATHAFRAAGATARAIEDFGRLIALVPRHGGLFFRQRERGSQNAGRV